MIAFVAFLVLLSSLVLRTMQPDWSDFGASLDGTSFLLGSTAPLTTALRRRRGRPRKFAAPSRAVTLTLPESVLEALVKINSDPSRAIVHLTSRRAAHNGSAAAELSVFGQRAVILVKPSSTLEDRAGIDLVPLPDGRALISFDQPRTIAELELILYDALEDRKLADEDRKIFEGIAAILTEARRSNDVKLLRRSIIILESSHKPKAPGKRARNT